jgi:hypothetical protein
MIKTVLKVLKYTLTVVGVFYWSLGSMWLLNQKSSIANVGGLLSFVVLGAVIGTYIQNKLKQD